MWLCIYSHLLCKVTEWYSDYIQDIQGLFWPRFLRNETLTLGSDGIWPKIKFELLFLVQQCKKSCQGVRLFLIYVLGSQAAAWLIHTQHESESGFFILVFTPNGEIQFHLWQSWLCSFCKPLLFWVFIFPFGVFDSALCVWWNLIYLPLRSCYLCWWFSALHQ